MIAILVAVPALAMTLSGAFELALKSHESPVIAELATAEANTRVDQALAGVLARVALMGSYQKQDVPETSRTISSEQTIARVNLAQPLFRGFAEYAALRAAKISAEAKVALESQSLVELKGQVADAYFSVLQAEKDRENLKIALEFTRKRNLETKQRAHSGRSRRSDILAGEAKATALEAQLSSGEVAVMKARRILTHLVRTGTDVILETGITKIELGALSEFLEALGHRGDIEALQKEVMSAEEAIAVARAGHYPSVDLNGNYYFQRSGSLFDSRWDVGITAAFPLFAGGGVEASVREASYKHRRLKVMFEKALREYQRDLTIIHEALGMGFQDVTLLSKGVELAKANYESLLKDFRFAQASSLEIITALEALLDAQRNLDRVIFENQRRFYQLHVLIGRIP